MLNFPADFDGAFFMLTTGHKRMKIGQTHAAIVGIQSARQGNPAGQERLVAAQFQQVAMLGINLCMTVKTGQQTYGGNQREKNLGCDLK